MKIIKEDIFPIVEKAKSIFHRLHSRLTSSNSIANEKASNSRIKKWCQVIAQGDWENFQKRLSWDNLKVSDIRSVLGNVRTSNEQNLPDWAIIVRDALEVAPTYLKDLEDDRVQEHSFLNPQHPVAFQEILLPFVCIAKQRIADKIPQQYQLLSESARSDLERSLLLELDYLFTQSLALEFSIFKTLRQFENELISLSGDNDSGNRLYRDFVANMLNGGLLNFFQEYSVLARLVGTVVDFWTETTREFILRLIQDKPEIELQFQCAVELDKITAVKPGLSDRHNQGRTVHIITFISDFQLVYKPKDIGIEEGYFNLLDFLNKLGVSLPFKVIKVLNRENYGWVEFVNHFSCQDEEAAKHFYRRAGMLVCITYLLGAIDCQFENIIASGEHPVLVDLETIIHPRTQNKNFPEKEPNYTANEYLFDSVLRTHLLPNCSSFIDEINFDCSGLNGVAGQKTSFTKLEWKNINTDSMELCYLYGETLPKNNLPSLHTRDLLASDYVDEIVAGFSEMYELFKIHRVSILSANSPLNKLLQESTRFVFRPTSSYSHILKRTLHPDFLRDGIERSIQIDLLSASLLSSETKPAAWSFIKAEHQALDQMDIPLFKSSSTSNEVTITPNQTVKGLFLETGFQRLHSRLNNLSNKDLEWQIELIRNSLYSSSKYREKYASNLIRNSLYSSLKYREEYVSNFAKNTYLLDKDRPQVDLDDLDLEQMAIMIAKNLQKKAIVSGDGSATWICPDNLPTAKPFRLKPVTYSLYDGACGIALFLAAVAKVTKKLEFADLAYKALQPLSRALQDSTVSKKLAEEIGIGGAVGLGSIVYSLVKISQILGKNYFFDDAKQAASLIAKDLIYADQKLDIVFGSAGAIVGMLALYTIEQDGKLLERIITCGQHLLENRITSKSGYKTWKTVDSKCLTGFSHGASGIAYALLNLYKITQDTNFMKAALDAFAYERSVFSPEARNWPDFRFKQPAFTTSWCHGAVGIGIARLRSLLIFDCKEIRQDLEAALKTTQQAEFSHLDNICCGNFGRVELLLMAGHQLLRPELLKIAETKIANLAFKSVERPGFQFFIDLPPAIDNPSFFCGNAGVGYELLRAKYFEVLPSVLAWE
ncbi:MAG: type 2 lantipeptide synthetase LanM [Symploca sp. SIO1B1]|nr:type 2 lantipeptide synthetase LanM [Symploca sp. SIO1B1]